MTKKIMLGIGITIVMLFCFNLNISANECSENATTATNCRECGSSYTWDSDSMKCSSVYQNYEGNEVVNCGSVGEVPKTLTTVVSVIYNIIQVAVPIVLVIFGMLDLFKGITAQKEDEIKKGQQILIKRIISACLVFFVFVIVKVIISIAADSSGNDILKCAECFIKNNCNG